MSGFSMHGEKESASAFALKRARRIAAICIAALMAFGALGLVGCSCSNTSTKTDDDNAKKEQVNDKKNATKTVPNVVGMTKDELTPSASSRTPGSPWERRRRRRAKRWSPAPSSARA